MKGESINGGGRITVTPSQAGCTAQSFSSETAAHNLSTLESSQRNKEILAPGDAALITSHDPLACSAHVVLRN